MGSAPLLSLATYYLENFNVIRKIKEFLMSKNNVCYELEAKSQYILHYEL